MPSVINDLGLVNMIDARLKPDEQEAITPGEAVKGMILNGLGFANRPLSLTPQFFAGKRLDLLFRPGVEADMFNLDDSPQLAVGLPYKGKSLRNRGVSSSCISL